ncbi:MAG: DUF3021 domain-containing protein [Lachnospiraceae bacterium]|nr:DUF3021 domain-containing protein [Lachnospiraceae bacterium]
MLKEVIKRCAISFAISAVCGLIVNLAIDVIVNAVGANAVGANADGGFISMAPEFRKLFATPVIAAYVNILLYGVIGATFSGMAFIFECPRIGYIVQSLIYFVSTAAVWIIITIILWQLHRYPQALIATIAGYAVTYLIMGTVTYKNLKNDINKINNALNVPE